MKIKTLIKRGKDGRGNEKTKKITISSRVVHIGDKKYIDTSNVI